MRRLSLVAADIPFGDVRGLEWFARGYGNLDQMIQLLEPWITKVDPLDKNRIVSEFASDNENLSNF